MQFGLVCSPGSSCSLTFFPRTFSMVQLCAASLLLGDAVFSAFILLSCTENPENPNFLKFVSSWSFNLSVSAYLRYTQTAGHRFSVIEGETSSFILLFGSKIRTDSLKSTTGLQFSLTNGKAELVWRLPVVEMESILCCDSLVNFAFL